MSGDLSIIGPQASCASVALLAGPRVSGILSLWSHGSQASCVSCSPFFLVSRSLIFSVFLGFVWLVSSIAFSVDFFTGEVFA